MYYIIYTTEQCNLECAYCESRASRSARTQEVSYAIDDLVDFLNQDDQLHLQFYGGEPLLRTGFIRAVLERTDPKRVCVQTNGFLLDQVEDELLDRIDVFSVSIDGPRHITDRTRGQGVYDRVVEQAIGLRARGFAGDIDARMTTSPGVQIHDAVNHFLGECAFDFDSIYWQLNVLFGERDWRWDRKFIKRWFETSYNPGITQLVDEWIRILRDEKRLVKIIPFARIMHTLVTGSEVDHIRCGAGVHSWTITPDGDLFPCPVLRASPDYRLASFTDLSPSQITPMRGLRSACGGCDELAVCGGRCIYATEAMRWGDEGFDLVCRSTKHMIAELREHVSTVERLIDAGDLRAEEYEHVGFDYEVIP
jgi:putative peptide-modifying radical SAM enzyme